MYSGPFILDISSIKSCFLFTPMLINLIKSTYTWQWQFLVRNTNIFVSTCHWVYTYFTGFLVPLPAVITALAVDDSKYSINPFFLPLCFSKNIDLNRYSIDLVVTILLLISIILLIIIIWKVHKVTTFFLLACRPCMEGGRCQLLSLKHYY